MPRFAGGTPSPDCERNGTELASNAILKWQEALHSVEATRRKSAVEAIKRIAIAETPFVANVLSSLNYMTEIIWEQASRPEKTWVVFRSGRREGRAVKLAERNQAYVIWGALPFLRYKQRHSSDFEILVYSDPLLQRVMVSIIARPEKLPRTNVVGAEAFQRYLLSPRAQAKISAFRSMGFDQQLWWPAGRDNSNEGGRDE